MDHVWLQSLVCLSPLPTAHLYLHTPLRWGWVFLERTRILSGIHNVFHRFFVVETKRFVSSFVNLTLTRQTCNQRSSRAAESKRRVLGNYFSQQICYMFLISKCRRDWGPGLAQLRYLRKEHCCAMLNSDFFCRRNTFFFRKSPLRCGSPNASTEVVHRPRSQTPLHFDIGNM